MITQLQKPVVVVKKGYINSENLTCSRPLPYSACPLFI